MFKLVLFDVDSTLINQEVIDLLAEQTQHGQKVAEITARAMAGEIDFDVALKERVALLAGLSEEVFLRVLEKITFTAGALELVAALKARGIAVGVVSGGFYNILDTLLAQLNLDFMRANTLQVEDGVLTGRIVGPIINRQAKAQALIDFAKQTGIELAQTVAVGDGSNDADMIKLSGLGISFCGKPILESIADISIKNRNLLEVLDYLPN